MARGCPLFPLSAMVLTESWECYTSTTCYEGQSLGDGLLDLVLDHRFPECGVTFGSERDHYVRLRGLTKVN